LAVDDMASMLEFARVFLSAAGYEVLVAGDGAEAIALLEREGGGVEGMITDYRLPDCNGLDLIQEVRGRWPHIRCLLTSGYIPEDETARIEGELGVGLLSKPYGARDALAAVGRLLEAAPEGPVLPTRRDSAG
jgi:DNA-binding NtrC family response regulator